MSYVCPVVFCSAPPTPSKGNNKHVSMWYVRTTRVNVSARAASSLQQHLLARAYVDVGWENMSFWGGAMSSCLAPDRLGVKTGVWVGYGVLPSLPSDLVLLIFRAVARGGGVPTYPDLVLGNLVAGRATVGAYKVGIPPRRLG